MVSWYSPDDTFHPHRHLLKFQTEWQDMGKCRYIIIYRRLNRKPLRASKNQNLIDVFSNVDNNLDEENKNFKEQQINNI